MAFMRHRGLRAGRPHSLYLRTAWKITLSGVRINNKIEKHGTNSHRSINSKDGNLYLFWSMHFINFSLK